MHAMNIWASKSLDQCRANNTSTNKQCSIDSIHPITLHTRTFSNMCTILSTYFNRIEISISPCASGFQVGLFRKSGVRSRIQQLRLACEAAGEEGQIGSFEEFTAFDVADMVKQYLRELPEVLLTSRVSQMLITIYQCKQGMEVG